MRYGKANNNWRGGRSITEHGYILIRVGSDHHLADVRGYAYEHRIVAEKTIGRRLRKREVVSHLDGNEKNNNPTNLKVYRSSAHLHHARAKRSDLRAPDDPNPIVKCACGCGKSFRKFDSSNRPRRFVSGHNPI